MSVCGALGACSSFPETSSRPDALRQIQPSKGPVQYARLTPGDAIPSFGQQRRSAAILPKPLLAKIVTPEKPLQCVPYARSLSNIQIRGNAWTWWAKADGRYARGPDPKAGSVLVLKRKNANSLGHVAFVEEVIDSRTLVVSHANWLNKGRLHHHAPVRDVSKANDWSAVRFWNTEGGHFGGNVYHPYGFIYQPQTIASR
jgi:hypothetical protein